MNNFFKTKTLIMIVLMISLTRSDKMYQKIFRNIDGIVSSFGLKDYFPNNVRTLYNMVSMICTVKELMCTVNIPNTLKNTFSNLSNPQRYSVNELDEVLKKLPTHEERMKKYLEERTRKGDNKSYCMYGEDVEIKTFIGCCSIPRSNIDEINDSDGYPDDNYINQELEERAKRTTKTAYTKKVYRRRMNETLC